MEPTANLLVVKPTDAHLMRQVFLQLVCLIACLGNISNSAGSYLAALWGANPFLTTLTSKLCGLLEPQSEDQNGVPHSPQCCYLF